MMIMGSLLSGSMMISSYLEKVILGSPSPSEMLKAFVGVILVDDTCHMYLLRGDLYCSSLEKYLEMVLVIFLVVCSNIPV